MTLSQRFTFEAGHRLDERLICQEEGERIHGHSYYVEITLSGETSRGMIMDSELFKRLGAKVVSWLDHRFLNDIEGLEQPTIENIGKWIFEKSLNRISANVVSVKVWRPSVGDCASIDAALKGGVED